jgi:hypothetical protein
MKSMKPMTAERETERDGLDRPAAVRADNRGAAARRPYEPHEHRVKEDPERATRRTGPARNGADASECDFESVIRDLVELGALDEGAGGG